MHVKSTITNIDFSQELSLQDLSCMSSQQEIRHKFDLDWWKAGRNVVPKPQWQVCNWIRRDVVREQQDRSKCRPGAAGQVEMSSWSRRTRRNVVPERQDRSKCRPGAAGQVEMSPRSSKTGRNVVRGQQDRSKAGQEFRSRTANLFLDIYIFTYIYIYISLYIYICICIYIYREREREKERERETRIYIYIYICVYGICGT